MSPMADLAIDPIEVSYVSGPTRFGAAGEPIAAGEISYLAADGAWRLAQCGGTAEQSGEGRHGMAVGSAVAAGQAIVMAMPGAVVDLGASAGAETLVTYVLSATPGKLAEVGDLAAGDLTVIAAIGKGSNRVKLLGVYDSGAVIG